MLAGQEKNFNKYNTSEVDTLGQPYDYGSIMHYGPHVFALPHTITITPKIPGMTLGQRQGLSAIDIKSTGAWFVTMLILHIIHSYGVFANKKKIIETK